MRLINAIGNSIRLRTNKAKRIKDLILMALMINHNVWLLDPLSTGDEVLLLVRFYKKSYGGLASSVMYGNSIEALKELVDSGAGTQVVKITSRGYKLPNGVHYCSIKVKTSSGEYLLQAYGKEANELYEKASFVLEGPMMVIAN